MPLTTPYCLEQLNELRAIAPDAIEFDAPDLYEITHGVNLKQHVLTLLPGYNTPAVLEHVEWWIEVAMAIANGRESEWRPDLPNAAVIPEFPELLARVLKAFPGALMDTPDFAGNDQDIKQSAALDLLKNYWHFTQAIRDKAREIWPEIDLGWLFVQT